ncbi:MAG: stage III sporulation protein AB [Lachnospiraceae bacterium]|nr:stage III sporulation protein AB [Lachnospiraceae bacterium]
MEMTMKLLGALLVLTGCTGTGWQRSEALGERVRSMEEISTVIWKIRGEIRVAGIPLGHVFLQVSDQVAAPWADVLRSLSRRMEAQEGERFQELWAAELPALHRERYRPEDWNCLLGLGQSLGYLDLTMQVELLDGFLAEWGRRTEECRREKQEKQKVCQCLGLAAGAFLVLLLV